MSTVAAAMIVKNEELVLARCLDAVREYVDEIVVADTGSTDRTIAIAQSKGARVVHFPWVDDFSTARQFAFDQATAEWVFWLDADDLVQGAERIRPVLASASDDIGVFQWKYVIGRNPDGSPAYSYWRERCARNNGQFRWAGGIHEVLLNHGPLRSEQTEAVFVEHLPPVGREKDPGRNLRILEKEYERTGGDPGTRTLFYLGREYADTGNVEKAIEILSRSGREDPWDDQRYLALIQVASLHVRNGDQDKAIDVYLEALKTHPTWPDAYLGLGEIYYYRKEWDNVIHWLDIGRSRARPAPPLFINEWKHKIEWLIFYDQRAFQHWQVGGSARVDNQGAVARSDQPMAHGQSRVFRQPARCLGSRAAIA
jgi:glycosyltransferase involved in cell wall biosynthesis